jgi:hypothetical protein
MPGVITKNGLSEILKRFGRLSYQSDVVVGLFTNNIVITKDSVMADLVEASYPGYVRRQVSSWSNPVVVGDTVQMDGAPVSFEPTSGTYQVWGYFVLRQDGTLIWAELFPSQVTLAVGSPLTITPRITLA